MSDAPFYAAHHWQSDFDGRAVGRSAYPLCIMVGDEHVRRAAGDPAEVIEALQTRDAASAAECILQCRGVAELLNITDGNVFVGCDGLAGAIDNFLSNIRFLRKAGDDVSDVVTGNIC